MIFVLGNEDVPRETTLCICGSILSWFALMDLCKDGHILNVELFYCEVRFVLISCYEETDNKLKVMSESEL